MKRFFLLLPLLWLCAAFPASGAAPAPDLRSALEALSSQGNGEAAYHLGMIHHLGLNGTAKDPRKAFALFRLATERGDPLGAYKLGCFYHGQGEGVVADDEDIALRYKLVAAEAGYALAQTDVAQIYAARKDFGQAVRWLEAAARQGDLRGLMTLSVYHSGKHPGLPGPKNPAREYAYMMLFFDRGEESFAPMKAAVEREFRARMSAREIEEGEAFAAAWRAGPTALTEKAGAGLDAARRLAGMATP